MRVIVLNIFTICLFFGFISCNSMLQNKGTVYYVNTKGGDTNEGLDNKDFINYNMLDSAWRRLNGLFNARGKAIESATTSEGETRTNNKEVRELESLLTELTTAVTSAIAGIYCLVKVILSIVNKFKK